MKFSLSSAVLILFTTLGFAQNDKDKLALAVNSADEANTEKLKAYIWKRKSDVSVNGQQKLTTLTEFSFDDQGKLQAKMVDAESSVEQKRGLRGRAQQNAAEDKADYSVKALELALAYTFIQKDGVIEATGDNIYVKGDKLTLWIDAKTNLYTKKKFSSLIGADPIDGEINYEKFSSGVNHGSTTTLNMPAQKMVIKATNQDYTQRVK